MRDFVTDEFLEQMASTNKVTMTLLHFSRIFDWFLENCAALSEVFLIWLLTWKKLISHGPHAHVKMLLILIFLAYFSFSNGLYLGTSIDRSDINQSIKSLQLALQDNNNCEIKLFNEPNFRGDNIGVTKAKERCIYGEKTRHSIDRSIGFSDVQSLQIVGHCCWEIYRWFTF